MPSNLTRSHGKDDFLLHVGLALSDLDPKAKPAEVQVHALRCFNRGLTVRATCEDWLRQKQPRKRVLTVLQEEEAR